MVVRPAPFAKGSVRHRFARGREHPRGVAWFGIRSFWGHLRHFAASAIATEDVDSRDWMTPDDPRALAERVTRLLGGAGTGTTVTERLGRDVWIDYVADTGDDVAVSRAVARLLFADYEVPDLGRAGAVLRAPRGDVLLFGGDTAYPVATADEIRDRVIVPFNQVLKERDDGRRRVLIGIPGNHDWYDGLDGFGRMFRRRIDYDRTGAARPTLHGSTRTLLGHYAEWAVEFVRGGSVEKPKMLDLIGYTAVQSASYFVLPLAPGLPMLAVDRQLKTLDARQRFFFAGFLNQNVGASPWVVLPDPVYAFGKPSQTGVESIGALGLTLAARPHFVLSGDIHHYRRELEGPTLHVTAGGGGAFLHPAPVSRADARPAVAEWPELPQSRALLLQVPWKIAMGRSGFLPHVAFTVLFAPQVLAGRKPVIGSGTDIAMTAIAAVLLALIGGVRKKPPVALLALLVSIAMFGTSVVVRRELDQVLAHVFSGHLASWTASLAQLAVAVPVGAYLFGAYLALLTVFGFENTQAFTALDHPGFKHFVRFRVRADGSAIDGWVLGLSNPVDSGEQPVLVDTFTWKSR